MCFIFHKWEKWQETDSGVFRDINTKREMGRFVVLKRVCEKCGKLQFTEKHILLEGYY